MRRRGSLLATLLLATLTAAAQAATPGEACREQAAAAEQATGIPSGLLLAIGLRESGVRDGGSGALLPWPWAVNRDGAGRILASHEEAVSYVRAAQAQGAHSIDVGCFQISLLHHPYAFANLDEAFDPAANAAYAARFLTSLHGLTGSWESAVAAYHSSDPARGLPYRDGVLAAWHGRGFTAAAGAPSVANGMVIMGMHIWKPSTASATPTYIRTSRLPAVITPAGARRL
jgi:hypothetical protein